jgi:beta-glucosidase
VASIPVSLEGHTNRPEALTLDSTVKAWFGHPIVGPVLLEGMMQDNGPDQQEATEKGLEMLKMVDSMPMAQFARMPMVGIPEESLHQLIQLSNAH